MCVRAHLAATLLAWLVVLPAAAQDGEAPVDEPCVTPPPVEIARILSRGDRDTARLVLTDCEGRPNLAALDELSILARAPGSDRPPAAVPADAAPDEAAPATPPLRVDPGLLVRLQAIADRWPGRQIRIVSGHRPRSRPTSRHHHGQALDIDVLGVPREEVAELARTLPSTGVGYYPNSVFTHIDVREEGRYWVDRSGPGERPDYGQWPPSPEEEQDSRQEVLALARAALEVLRPAEDPATPAASSGAPPDAGQEPPLTDEEVRQLREAAVATLLTLLEPSGR